MTNKSTQPILISHDKDKKRKYISGGIVVILIAITPYLLHIYQSFPYTTQEWETLLFSMKTNYPSMQHYTWYLTGKAVPLYLLFIWFFTCKHWWHWIILVPIFMYIFQLWGIINQSKNIDEVEWIYMIPVMLIVIPAVYLIRAKLFHKVRDTDLKELEEELKKERTLLDELKELFR